MNTDHFLYCPVCGASLSPDFDFCPECGFDFGADAKRFSFEQEGILLTDSAVLAEKYRRKRREILAVLTGIIAEAEKTGMNWHLLDINTKTNNVNGGLSWEEVNDLVSAFIEEQGLVAGPELNLMIIGGDDVIPIPGIEDPYPYGEGVIPSDMCYSFQGCMLQEYMEGGVGDIQVESARNVVARLPLEEGIIDTSPESDLAAYFQRCHSVADGIPVSGAVMTSFSDWIPASSTMTQHLPLIWQEDDPELICNRMYISPKLLTSDMQSIDIYKNSLARGDLLLFNLHGCDDPEYAGFYSVDEAFSPDLLSCTKANILNTVACFGARYTGYERQESMLMRALFENKVLLYTGSMVSVPMFSAIDGDEARELLLNPGTGSEVFMRLYTLYQYKGLSAGYALLQAKCDYYNMCRHLESDSFSLSTILMFSLYGNPMLHFQPREDVIRSALSNGAVPSKPVKSRGPKFRKKSITPLYCKGMEITDSVLARVRSAVDSNLSSIQHSIQTSLYRQLGLTAGMLEEISRYEDESPLIRDSGYSFKYHNPHTRFSADVWIDTSRNGTIKRIYSTK